MSWDLTLPELPSHIASVHKDKWGGVWCHGT